MALLLAADPTTLAPAAAGSENLIALIDQAFTPSELITPAALHIASFNGATAKAVKFGTQPTGDDPLSADCIIDLLSVDGAFRFQTADAVGMPVSIYGFALFNNALTTVLACETFPTPIQLTGPGQVIDISDAQLRQLAGSLQ
jgi:hypothetical protein